MERSIAIYRAVRATGIVRIAAQVTIRTKKRFKGKSNGFRGRRDSTRVAFFLTNKFLREKASTYDVKRIDDSSNVFEINE